MIGLQKPPTTIEIVMFIRIWNPEGLKTIPLAFTHLYGYPLSASQSSDIS